MFDIWRSKEPCGSAFLALSQYPGLTFPYTSMHYGWLEWNLNHQPFRHLSNIIKYSRCFHPWLCVTLPFCCCLYLHLTIFLFLERFLPGGLDRSIPGQCVRVRRWDEVRVNVWPFERSGCAAVYHFFSRAKSPLIFFLQHTIHPALFDHSSLSVHS